MADLEKQAKEAFIDDHFELAVDLYTQAIALNPTNPDLLADRAQANIKLNSLTEAVADASKAIELDPSMAKAYLRKGIACMKLEEYQTAKAALVAGASLATEESRFANLIKECDERIAEETGETKKASSGGPSKRSFPKRRARRHFLSGSDGNTFQVKVQAMLVKDCFYPETFWHEFYQKPEEVVVTIFAKGIPANSVTVDFGEQILSVRINVPGEDAYHFQTRLFGKIILDKCKFNVLSTKVEIRLTKAQAGLPWASLEYRKETAVVKGITVSSEIAHRPTYPSSKPKGVDWDKLEAEVKKEEKEEKLDGDAALNKFFREIYQDADEDTRRAMQKSFVESNGTVLSTNWKEVGTKTVEGSPPDGMEMRKWEY